MEDKLFVIKKWVLGSLVSERIYLLGLWKYSLQSVITHWSYRLSVSKIKVQSIWELKLTIYKKNINFQNDFILLIIEISLYHINTSLSKFDMEHNFVRQNLDGTEPLIYVASRKSVLEIINRGRYCLRDPA